MRKLIRLLARDQHARVMRSTVQKVNGGWVISFTVKRSAKQRSVRKPNAAVGVDVGISRLATTSTGHMAVNSRPLQGSLRTLRRLQRQVERQRRAGNPEHYFPDGRIKPGPKTWVTSKRMERTQERIRKLHKRVADLRHEQAHQLTTALVREFGVIGVESLAVKNMLKNRRLARHISDVGWGMILAQLKYKTAWSGSFLSAANRYYPSSKTCSECTAVKAKLRLSERVFTCDTCGHVQDRDENAGVNLAVMAQADAQAHGITSYVARTGRFTPTARGGQVSLVVLDQQSPLKREASSDVSQRGDALALAS